MGIFPDPLSATAASASEHFLSQLYPSNQLLNPLIGMTFGPSNPKITIGALDENDCQRNLNWVPTIIPNSSWKYATIDTGIVRQASCLVRLVGNNLIGPFRKSLSTSVCPMLPPISVKRDTLVGSTYCNYQRCGLSH
ncbi:hypothetical protein JVU11DRAFT_3869 [Chiua virens]|nr:hypothetical protein JVU11DRAFT_3869 [Chiua virens]